MLSEGRETAGGAVFRRISVAALALIGSACVAMAQPQVPDGPLPRPEGRILLTIEGDIANTNADGVAKFDRAMLDRLPHHLLKTHTVVTDGVKTFDGFLMRDLLKWVGARGKTVTCIALNDYVIDIPASDFRKFDVLVATRMDGVRLEPSDKGPLWIVYPRDDHEELQDLRYDYRWVWQLYQLQVQ